MPTTARYNSVKPVRADFSKDGRPQKHLILKGGLATNRRHGEEALSSAAAIMRGFFSRSLTFDWTCNGFRSRHRQTCRLIIVERVGPNGSRCDSLVKTHETHIVE